MEGESCRSRLGDALSPGKDFKFPYVRLRAYVYFDFVVRIDLLLSSFGLGPRGIINSGFVCASLTIKNLFAYYLSFRVFFVSFKFNSHY
jgi:hypothetical protein